ncbi:MAG TPA: VWA domain-containing protein [Blastocatellia bacterium]|nr:VWA domain-containing protein [Blastocatellia bacterium]
MRIRVLYILNILFLTTGFTLICSSQTPSQSKTDDVIACVFRTEIVTLDVQVINKKTGQVIDNLRHTDFEIYEDGVAQNIVMMSVGYRDLSVVFLIDTNLAFIRRDEKLEEHFTEVIQSFGIKSEFAIIGLQENAPIPSQELTSDHKKLTARLRSLKKAPPQVAASNSINEKIRSGVLHLKQASPGLGSKVVIVITGESTSLLRDRTTLQALYNSNYIVYGVVVSEGKNGISVNSALHFYAENTGGEILHLQTNRFAEQFVLVANRIRNRYLLGYEPTNEKRDGNFRYVNVGLKAEKKRELGNVIVHTRLGYYAPSNNEK